MILTYLWSWNKIKVIKPGMNCKTPSKVIITQSLKDLPQTVPAKKPMLIIFVKSENTSVISLNMCQSENSGIFIIYLTYLTILQTFNLIG